MAHTSIYVQGHTLAVPKVQWDTGRKKTQEVPLFRAVCYAQKRVMKIHLGSLRPLTGCPYPQLAPHTSFLEPKCPPCWSAMLVSSTTAHGHPASLSMAAHTGLLPALGSAPQGFGPWPGNPTGFGASTAFSISRSSRCTRWLWLTPKDVLYRSTV